MKISRLILILICSIFIINDSQAQIPQLWGMAYHGGSYSFGTIYKINGDGTGFNTAYSFHYPNGIEPYGSLIQALDGKLYGMTLNGGTDSLGTIFSFDSQLNTYLHRLDLHTVSGTHPYGSLLQLPNGTMYGLTSNGGASNYGTLFSYDAYNNVLTNLHDFTVTTGYIAYGSLIKGNDGKLYGVTYQGGAHGYGVIFSFDPTNNTYTDLFDFNYSVSGAYPFGSMMKAASGKFYGVTYSGGTNSSGVLYSFDPATSTFTNAHNFISTTGDNPFGTLVQHYNGKIYGFSTYGGGQNYGNIFSLDTATNNYTVIHDFSYVDGGDPRGGMTIGRDSIIYGVTSYGGPGGFGVLFKLIPATNAYSTLHIMNNASGTYPQYTSLLQFNPLVTEVLSPAANTNSSSVYPNPFSNQATLDLNGIDNSNGSRLSILNILGQEVRTINTENKSEIILTRGNLEPGMYIYKLLSATKETLATGKFIIE
ncbi:MAG: choice-of-anchor tandem repeat GloVer-containing protein [Bacteroidota bacterium]